MGDCLVTVQWHISHTYQLTQLLDHKIFEPIQPSPSHLPMLLWFQTVLYAFAVDNRSDTW